MEALKRQLPCITEGGSLASVLEHRLNCGMHGHGIRAVIRLRAHVQDVLPGDAKETAPAHHRGRQSGLSPGALHVLRHEPGPSGAGLPGPAGACV